MSNTSSVSIELLADHPHLIPAVGELRWREWGHPPEPERLGWWVDISAREAGREKLPITWVAIHPRGHAVGAVGLGEFDIEQRRDRSPWVLGMIVDVHYRNQGIGRKLMEALELWAHRKGFSRTWVATGGRAVDFYQKCGWELAEIIDSPSGEMVSVLTKSI